MKYVKYITAILISAGLLLICFKIRQHASQVRLQDQNTSQKASAEHIYASWDTMEFDKCVANWLILRFIDKDAKFVLHPAGTEIKEGILFDVPGANWSRKHLKCTSQCILEAINNPDSAVEEIVSIAGKIELNFWQLDRWPDAQKCFYEAKKIMDQNPNPLECFAKTRPYFDRLYDEFKKKTDSNTGTKKERI